MTNIIINFMISLVAGLATGAFFATRPQPGPLPVQFFTNQKIKVEYTNINTDNSLFLTREKDNTSVLILIIIGVVLIIMFFANYYPKILYFGWISIIFFSASIISFIVISFWWHKYLSHWYIWCLICLCIIIYEFLLFSRSLTDPTYASYLNTLRQKGVEAIIFSLWGFMPAYQFIGIISLGLAMIIVFLQSLAVLIWPLACYNKNVFSVFRLCSRFLSRCVVLGQILLLFLAFSILSGKFIGWFGVLSRLTP